MRKLRGEYGGYIHRLMYDVQYNKLMQRREGTQALSGKKYVIAATGDQSFVCSYT